MFNLVPFLDNHKFKVNTHLFFSCAASQLVSQLDYYFLDRYLFFIQSKQLFSRPGVATLLVPPKKLAGTKISSKKTWRAKFDLRKP